MALLGLSVKETHLDGCLVSNIEVDKRKLVC